MVTEERETAQVDISLEKQSIFTLTRTEASMAPVAIVEDSLFPVIFAFPVLHREMKVLPQRVDKNHKGHF